MENFAITSFVREGLGKFPNSHTGVPCQKEKGKAKRLANRLIKSSPKQNSKCVPICRAQNFIPLLLPLCYNLFNKYACTYMQFVITYHFPFNFIFDSVWFKNTIHSNVVCIGKNPIISQLMNISPPAYLFERVAIFNTSHFNNSCI